MTLRTGRLRLLSPTDCVKDRLAAYFHWDDMQSLAQAALVAYANEIDLAEVESWATREGKREAFVAIRDELATPKRSGGT